MPGRHSYDRKEDGKPAPDIYFRGDGNAPPMEPDDALRHGQPEAAPGFPRLSSIEALENVRQILPGYPLAVIANPQLQDSTFLPESRAYFDPAIFRRILEGIVYEVAQRD